MEKLFHIKITIIFISWDEWVPESRVLKINEMNLQKQKELQQQHPLVE